MINLKSKIKKIKFVITPLLLVLLVIPILIIHADDSSVAPSTSIGVDPAITEVVLNETKPSEQIIHLYNLTDTALPITTTKESFSIKEKANLPKEKLQIYDASSWINISEEDTNFILQPKEIKEIKLEIKQPKDASPGGHYATVYFQPLIPESLISNQSTSVFVRVGVLILMQNPGNIIEKLQIKDFSTIRLTDNSNITFNLTLENPGNTHVLPTGKVDIYNDLTNKVVASKEIAAGLVLPGLDKTITINLDANSQIGKYSAQVVLNYGVGNKKLESNKLTTYVFPFKQFILIAALLLFILIFRKRLIKALKILFKRKDQKNSIVGIN